MSDSNFIKILNISELKGIYYLNEHVLYIFSNIWVKFGKIQNWESSLVDPDKSFVNRKLTLQNANGTLFQSETIH